MVPGTWHPSPMPTYLPDYQVLTELNVYRCLFETWYLNLGSCLNNNRYLPDRKVRVSAMFTLTTLD